MEDSEGGGTKVVAGKKKLEKMTKTKMTTAMPNLEMTKKTAAPCDGTNKNRSFQCETCQQSFARKSNLTQHIRCHTDERPFQCETCQATFRQKVHLTQHILSHTGERPFQCVTCQATFRQIGHLTQHILSHTGKRPFQCETCQQTFTRKEQLTQHIRSHTGEVEFVLDYTDERTLSQQNDAAEKMAIELVKWSKERVDAKKGALWYIGGGRNGISTLCGLAVSSIRQQPL